jgi:hypothetical protein
MPSKHAQPAFGCRYSPVAVLTDSALPGCWARLVLLTRAIFVCSTVGSGLEYEPAAGYVTACVLRQSFCLLLPVQIPAVYSAPANILRVNPT